MIPLQPVGFRTRLTLRWTAVFSCILAVGSAWIYFGIRSTTYTGLDRQLLTLAGTEVNSVLDRPTSSPHIHELPLQSLAGSAFTEKLVQVLDGSGRVVIASPGTAERAGRLIDDEQFAAALGGAAPITTSEAGGVPVRVVALRARADGDTYVIAVAVVITSVLESLSRVRWLLALVWLASTVATAGAGFALASTALSPVTRITRRAMDIATNDLRARLEPPLVDDEIGRMTTSFNALLERLHVALDANRRFAADAAHELRSPVTAIAGEIQVALRRDRSPDEYRDTLELVQGRLSSLTGLIADLMLLVRAQEGRAELHPEELALSAVLAPSTAPLHALMRARDIRLETHGVESLMLYGEAGLLGRVFSNVLENAVRYNRDGGLVRIDASFEDARADTWSPGRVTVRVHDTGSGIPDSDRERVFERFYRVDLSRARHTGGAGLGLAIAREVLLLFRGTIAIVESSSAGTTVEITMPGRMISTSEQPSTPTPALADHV